MHTRAALMATLPAIALAFAPGLAAAQQAPAADPAQPAETAPAEQQAADAPTRLEDVPPHDHIMELGQAELDKYAAFAKIEANIAEASAGLFLQQLLSGEDAERALEIDDYRQDFDAVEEYVAQLEGMDLTEEERQALDRFQDGWSDLQEMRQAIEGAEEAEPDQIIAYWEQVTRLDDVVDNVLDSIATGDALTQ
jgi:hypothetical protein